MYERITIRHPHPHEDFITINETKQLPDTEQSRKVLNRLCDLEDKIEQGKILELPCAVGQKAYHLTSAETLEELEVAEIFEGKVCSFSKDEKGLWIFCRYDNGLTYWYKETDIGTKLFLDRASAEAKVREMEGDNNEQR